MAILAECPSCRIKQSVKNKLCKCGGDLDKAKQSKKIRYWINYRLPSGKQKREPVKGKGIKPYSIEHAKDMESKRKVQKREKRIFDVKPDTELSFKEIADWYLSQSDVTGLLDETKKEKEPFWSILVKGKPTKPSWRVSAIKLKNLCEDIGNKVVCDVQPQDLEDYRTKRENKGLSDAYIDDEITAGKTVINRAFKNNMISSETLNNWRSVKKALSPGDNARQGHITPQMHYKLHDKGADHLKLILTALYWTGLRPNADVLPLEWDRVDLANRTIRFEVKRHRNQKPKPCMIYIADELLEELRKNRFRDAGEDSHVFQYNGTPIQEITTAFKTACEEAGVKYGDKVPGGIVPYTYRHTLQNDMRKAGVNPWVIEAFVGHSLGGSKVHYQKIDIDDFKEAIEKVQVYRARLKEDSERQNIDSSQNVDQTVD